jgi:Zn-dependent protease with chaperone function
MKKLYFVLAVCALMVMMGAGSVLAQETTPEVPVLGSRDPVFEQAIYDKLDAINPQAVPLFKQATEALDAGDSTEAKRLYKRVLELAPDFPDALRRLSYAEGDLGNLNIALEYARRAYEVDPSPYNQIGIANVLILFEQKVKTGEALALIKEAANALPNDVDANARLLEIGLIAEDTFAIRQATERLLVLAPEMPPAHFFAGLVAAEEGDWEKAEAEILLSRELGMPEEAIQFALEQGISTQANLQRIGRAGIYGIIGWVVGFPVLLAIGSVLSLLTMQTALRQQSSPEFRISPAEYVIRFIYQVVITLTSLYFYVSIPLLILAVLAVAGGIFYVFFIIGRIPVQIAVIVIVGVFYTLIAIVRSVFTRVRDADPGRLLPQAESPGLWKVAEEVAAKVGARPIDAIYITPGTEIAVTERGSLLSKLRGTGKRCLVLGLGVLPGLTQSQFKAILAHEYGHFTNRDTAGGNLAYQVKTSLHRMAYSLAASGQAHWFNPVWLFINGFYRVFLRITLGASRLQEILADRYAAMAYGKRNFIEGLKHTVRQNVVFDFQANHEVQASHNQRRMLGNLYRLSPIEAPALLEKVEKQVEEVMSRTTSAYDSHPSVRYRIKLVEQLGILESGEYNSDPVSDLIHNLETLQSEMMALIRKNIKQNQS